MEYANIFLKENKARVSPKHITALKEIYGYVVITYLEVV